jgi:excisionase family DNA binding protein
MARQSPKTLSIPQAGKRYYNLSKNGSYAAAERGEIPFIQVGRLRRVPVTAMERIMEECGRPAQAAPASPRAQPPPASPRARPPRSSSRNQATA